MRKQRCEDCGMAFAPWDRVYHWPEGNGERQLCQCCTEARLEELTLRDVARVIGVTEWTAEELRT